MTEDQINALVVDNLPLVKAVVRGTLSRGVPTYVEADDLIQECSLRLYQALQTYRGDNGASIKTYLKTVIRRDVLDLIEREREQPLHKCRSGENVLPYFEPSPSAEPESGAEFKRAVSENSEISSLFNLWHRERGAEKRMALRREFLTPEQFDVVELCYVSGVSQDEAAMRLGISRNAVKSRLQKAVANLQKHVPCQR